MGSAGAEKEVAKGDHNSESFPPVYETYERSKYKGRSASSTAGGATAHATEALRQQGAQRRGASADDTDPSWRMQASDSGADPWDGMTEVQQAVQEAAQELSQQPSSSISSPTASSTIGSVSAASGSAADTAKPTTSCRSSRSADAVHPTSSNGTAGNTSDAGAGDGAFVEVTSSEKEEEPEVLYSFRDQGTPPSAGARGDPACTSPPDEKSRSEGSSPHARSTQSSEHATEREAQQPSESLDATVVMSASGAKPYFTSDNSGAEQRIQPVAGHTIDVRAEAPAASPAESRSAAESPKSVRDSARGSPVGTGASSTSGITRGRVGSNALRVPSVVASGGLDDVIAGSEDGGSGTDDEVWLQGYKAASAQRDGGVRSKRTQRGSRPKPTLPSSMVTEQGTSGGDGAPQRVQQKSGATLPWLTPDDNVPMHKEQEQPRDSSLGMPQKSPEDLSMDAISRALKSGVDKETLKQYIDEVAETVADKAGVIVRASFPFLEGVNVMHHVDGTARDVSNIVGVSHILHVLLSLSTYSNTHSNSQY